MDKRILKLLAELVALKSVSGTSGEKEIENFLLAHLQMLPYFKEYPALCGAMPIPGDAMGRRIVYGLVRGKSAAAVILMNHHDVVTTSVYGAAESWACNVQELPVHLQSVSMNAEARADGQGNEWLWGRGVCDMKGGMAAQLAVLAEYAQNPEQGSLLFLSVPDEEAFSAGMRGALPFLQQLKEQQQLDYKLLINCEPNRREGIRQVVSVGSVGKLLPVVLVQGKVVQIGSYAAGLNPASVLAELVVRTEGDAGFVETCGGEQTVPPVWYFMRDLKDGYDYSLPSQAAGYCNVLTFERTAGQVLAYFVEQAEAAVQAALAKQQKLAAVPGVTTTPVLTFGDLQEKAAALPDYADFKMQLNEELGLKLQSQELDYPRATITSLQKTLAFAQIATPVVVVGFAPPYYPALNSERMERQGYQELEELVAASLPAKMEQYFLGVSDCSYCGSAGRVASDLYTANTPLWGDRYSFDWQALSAMTVPFFLMGPWGKDLHQSTERVNRYSLTVELPAILHKVICKAWELM